MVPHEFFDPNRPQPSEKAMQGFWSACADLSRYGTFVRTKPKRPILHELDVIDDSVVVTRRPEPGKVTHQSSGLIFVDEKWAPWISEIWTPLEGVTPRSVRLMGESATLKTVVREGTEKAFDASRQLITTAEGRMYETQFYDTTPTVTTEFDVDWAVEANTDSLRAFEQYLHGEYPEVNPGKTDYFKRQF